MSYMSALAHRRRPSALLGIHDVEFARVLSLDAEEEQAPLTRREEAHGCAHNSSACGDGSGQNLEK
jgi:hypothetical protein